MNIGTSDKLMYLKGTIISSFTLFLITLVVTAIPNIRDGDISLSSWNFMKTPTCVAISTFVIVGILNIRYHRNGAEPVRITIIKLIDSLIRV